MVKKIVLIIMLILAPILFSSCEEENNKIIIAVSIVPECTFVEKVCGDLVDIVTLIPPGYSPETSEPGFKDMLKFNKASIYFSIGVPTEKVNILPHVSKNTKVVELHTEVSSVYNDVFFESGGRDPHIWLSPKRVIVIVNRILSEMKMLDPDNAKTYEENADKFIDELNTLDLEIKEAIEESKVKEFIVFHPAFGYLASDYGLTMLSLEKNGKEATPKELNEMANYAKENNIKVIFYQAEIDGSQAEAFAEQIGGKAVKLEPLAADYILNLRTMANAIADTATNN